MESFWEFMQSTGFLLTAFGAFIGFLSWMGGREARRLRAEGNANLQKSIDEGNARLQKSIDEGNARLQKSIDEGNARLQKSIDEGNARLQESIEQGNKRLELILSAMQARWDQSDEFNKRMLDKILDRVA